LCKLFEIVRVEFNENSSGRCVYMYCIMYEKLDGAQIYGKHVFGTDSVKK